MLLAILTSATVALSPACQAGSTKLNTWPTVDAAFALVEADSATKIEKATAGCSVAIVKNHSCYAEFDWTNQEGDLNRLAGNVNKVDPLAKTCYLEGHMVGLFPLTGLSPCTVHFKKMNVGFVAGECNSDDLIELQAKWSHSCRVNLAASGVTNCSMTWNHKHCIAPLIES